MATVIMSLSPAQTIELAVHSKSPAQLAQAFASYVGQFPDRADFDALARRTHDLYATRSEDFAYAFRSRLDRRLYDRYHEPVAWETGPRPHLNAG